LDDLLKYLEFDAFIVAEGGRAEACLFGSGDISCVLLLVIPWV
jgi:hypothetical protein